MSSTDDTRDFGTFMIGFFIGIFIFTIFYVLIALDSPIVIKSYKKITPETTLTTDGKTIDTLFIYKSEN